MESIRKFFEELGINIIFVIAGAFGGYLKQMRNKELSFVERMGIVAAGSIIANYLGPVIGHWLNVSNEAKYGFAFLLGYISIEVLEILGGKLKFYLKSFKIKSNNNDE